MDSENFGLLLAITFAALALTATMWLARPSLRRNPYLAVVFVATATALFLEVAFVGLFLITLAGMPDMREL